MSDCTSTPALDHLVVMADTLQAGADWCQATLGVTPGAGGAHPLFGTHNRLLALGGGGFAHSYLEIIAIDPQAQAPRRRWFDMDDERLRAQVRTHGPQLIHWVARVPDARAAVAALAAQGLARGEVLGASRMTPAGLLQWQIAVRPDGQRLLGGCLPTVIEWGAVHPASTLPASGVALQGLTLCHPQAERLQGALQALGLTDVRVEPGPAAALQARLQTPRGEVVLRGV